MENLFLGKAIQEISGDLKGSRVERVSGIPPASIVLAFSKGRAATPLSLVVCLDPAFPCLFTLEGPAPDAPAGENPEGFIQFMAERLPGAVVNHVQQHERDRVAKIAFARRPETAESTLWVELFGRKPVAALVDTSTERIVACSHEGGRSGSGNVLRTGTVYAAPRGTNKIGVEAVSPELLGSWIEESTDEQLSTRLSRRIVGLSPQAALEIVAAVADPGTGAATETTPGVEAGDFSTPQRLLESLRQHLLEPDKYFRPAVRQASVVHAHVSGTGVRFDVTLFPFGATPYQRDPNYRVRHFEAALPALRFGFYELCRWHRALASARLRASSVALEEKLRKLEATLAQELLAAGRDRDYGRRGELILANLKAIKRGSNLAEFKDIHGDGETTVEVLLDPALSPSENAERYFKKARKAKRAVEILRRRLAEITRTLGGVEEFASQIPDEVGSADVAVFSQRLEAIARKASRRGLAGRRARVAKEHETEYRRRVARARSVGRQSAPRGPRKFNPRTFTTSDGHLIIVGRSNEENDYVTHRLAKPEDLWFHAYGVAGSHVVLRRKDKSAPSRKAVEETASIAAYFSKAKTSSSVPVIYTQKKYVNKPKGARPGVAVCAREKLLMARPLKPLS